MFDKDAVQVLDRMKKALKVIEADEANVMHQFLNENVEVVEASL